MLLKLCAIPLARDPIICIRRARSSRVASVARSRSRNSRSIALTIASPARRTTGRGNILSHAGWKVTNPLRAWSRAVSYKGGAAPAPDTGVLVGFLVLARGRGGDVGLGRD